MTTRLTQNRALACATAGVFYLATSAIANEQAPAYDARLSDYQYLFNELGRFDRLGKTAVEHIPDAYLHELDDIGHMPQFEAFNRYRDLLDKIF